jgi:hypothetical protein
MQFQLASEPIRNAVMKIHNSMTKLVTAYPDIFKNIYQLANELKELPERQRAIWRVAAEKGWYVNWETPVVINKAVLEGQEALDEFMMSHLKNDWESITHEILAVCPEREEILLCSFDLHQNKNYIASIPLFLSQSDGICAQYLGAFLFTEKEKLSEKLSQRLKDEGWYIEMLLSILGISTQFGAGIKKSSSSSKALAPNRSGILHGSLKHIDYGTERNSFKAFSLLAFLAFVLADRRDVDET